MRPCTVLFFDRSVQGFYCRENADNPENGTREENETMGILEQCQMWHEQDEYQKIADALEALPTDERTADVDMELARAYNNLGVACEDRRLLRKAIQLMKAHEEELCETYSWNFRMGYSWYHLEQEGRALVFFHRALELHPGNDAKINTKQEILRFISQCEKCITRPIFEECFRERTKKAWETFAEQESQLRRIMDEDKDHRRSHELITQCGEILDLAFDNISFEMGFDGEKYELILTPEGDRVKLFELVYFQEHVPEEVLKHWAVTVGRQPADDAGLWFDRWKISGKDVQIWIERTGEKSFSMSAYCEKLMPLIREDRGQVWWMLTTLTDQVLGEIPNMRYIEEFDLLDEPRKESHILLAELPEKLREYGMDLSVDPHACLESYMGYQMEADEDPDADWRMDIIAGSTCCDAIVSGYLEGENDYMDDLHADGAVAGFLCYPLDTLREEKGSQKIFDFRDRLEEYLGSDCGSDTLILTGGGTGLYCGYVDFIAWDLDRALDHAKEYFDDTDIPWAVFHTFRREAGTVGLKSPDEGSLQTDGRQEGEGGRSSDDQGYVPYTLENADEFYRQIEKWNDEDKYSRCIETLDGIPAELRDYRWAYTLARALENYAVIGDQDENASDEEAEKALSRAIDVLESVRKEGQDKAEWNMRMAYGYQYLNGQKEKALIYARRWAELDPKDRCAMMVIRECKDEINKQRSQDRLRKGSGSAPGDIPFDGFDFDGFWDDDEYALKEYVCDPPSDQMIADIEEELGYKLPASYIWLMKRHNGGIPVNNCCPTDEPTIWADDHVAITGIFGIGRDKPYSLCGTLGSQFMIDEWEYPAIGVAICDCPSAGHDMIFLDYRDCGPDGEPAVVHVDQENDYKITHLADSFEEFIRSLVNESVYDIEYDMEKDGTEKESKGAFVGFVLLSKEKWDKKKLIIDLKEKWDIIADEDTDRDRRDDALIFNMDNMIAAVSFMPYPVPGGEAAENAKNNYMWPGAVKAAEKHSAHIMVAVLGEEDDMLKKGELYVKLTAACCRQKYASGIYASGVVFEPEFYEDFANVMKEGRLPVFNWIWIGLYQSEFGISAYTYGMDMFGKDEMEVLEANGDPAELRDFLINLAAYVLENDAELHDGETVGFTADDKHTVMRSEGVALPDKMTLKISYGSDRENPDAENGDTDINDNYSRDGGRIQRHSGSGLPEVYTDKEMMTVEEHINKYFGEFECVFHELISTDIHVDICMIPPTEERDYNILVTMGMGAHLMNVPEELSEYKLERAELAIALPADWRMEHEAFSDERWYWPVRLLKDLARLPIECDTWLGWGHTIDGGGSFAKNTKLCASMLIGPQTEKEGGEVCILPGGEEVNFYQVIPLYRDELEYKMENDAEALLDKMQETSFVVQVNRRSAITGDAGDPRHFN